MGIGDSIDNRHWARQREFELFSSVGAGELRFAGMHAGAQTQRADHGWAHRLIAIVADSHLDTLVEVDAVHRFEEAMHEVLARLLAVGDDVDPGVLLNFECEQRCIVLGGGEFFAFEPPRRPQFFRRSKPGRLGQTSGNRRRKKRFAYGHGAACRADQVIDNPAGGRQSYSQS